MGIFNKKELEKIESMEKEIASLKLNLEGKKKEEWEVKKQIEGKDEKIAALQATVERFGGMEVLALEKEKAKIEEKCEIIQSRNHELLKQRDSLNKEIGEKKKELGYIDSDIEMMDFALYQPKYNCMDSEEYAWRIKYNREEQKDLIKLKLALNYLDTWTLDGSARQGSAMNNDNMKMYLRAFNNECDVLISKVKFNNFDKIKERIIKCAAALDKLNKRNQISVTQEYLNLKIDELHLVHEYNVKKQEEKEAMRAAREEEKELEKLRKEIEQKRKDISKEQMHYTNAKEKLLEQLKTCEESKKADIQKKIDGINETLKDIESKLKDIDYREANSKAGYVYIISNIGSFGEGIFKIGMTRRLNPMDRVNELGDASVPFKFDVHAMIFSDDAPALEAALHRAFDDRKVNMINGRKEFFRVPLQEIEKVVKDNHDKLIEFKHLADAEQYRETIKIRELLYK